MNRLNVIIDILHVMGINDRILANNINNNFNGSFKDIYGREYSYSSIRDRANNITQIYRRQ